MQNVQIAGPFENGQLLQLPALSPGRDPLDLASGSRLGVPFFLYPDSNCSLLQDHV